MRAVVDTVVLVRALIKPLGSVGPALRRLRDGDYTVIYSDALLDELVDVLNRPRIRDKYHLTAEDVATVVSLLLLRGESVTPTRRIAACRDPDDNAVLEAAVAGGADLIVTGDNDLLALDPFEGIRIVRPADFLALLDRAT